jgi:hypothetical protein
MYVINFVMFDSTSGQMWPLCVDTLITSNTQYMVDKICGKIVLIPVHKYDLD